MRVWLIEDDLHLGQSLGRAIQSQGWVMTWWRSLTQVPAVSQASPVDCVVLDLGLPDGDGLTLLRRWRSEHVTLPILVITARASLDDRLMGLDLGADDYLVKPFAVPELLSRLRAVHRRWAGQAHPRWRSGGVELRLDDLTVNCDGRPVELSPREHAILVALMQRPGRVVLKDQLAQWLEPHGEAISHASLEVHVSNLRRKVGGHHIRTLRGLGYQWVESPPDSSR